MGTDPRETENCMERVRRDNPDEIADLEARMYRRFVPNPYETHRT